MPLDEVTHGIADARDLLELAPDSCRKMLGLALVYRALGDPEPLNRALSWLRDAKTPEATVALSEFFAQSGDFEHAFQVLDRLYADWPPPEMNSRGFARALNLIRYSPYLRALRQDHRFARWFSTFRV